MRDLPKQALETVEKVMSGACVRQWKQRTVGRPAARMGLAEVVLKAKLHTQERPSEAVSEALQRGFAAFGGANQQFRKVIKTAVRPRHQGRWRESA